MTAFEDTTPFVLALLITFTALVGISIWNSYTSVKVEKEVLKPKNDGPSRTRELLIRFTKFYNDLDAHNNYLYDTQLLPNPKQHIIHALYVGFDESENDDERAAIERGIRAIATFQERVGELPIKKEISEIEKNLSRPNSEENISNTINSSNFNILSEDEFQKYSVLRDQELDTHFQHLKIETAEA